jgi:hypothetical protein
MRHHSLPVSFAPYSLPIEGQDVQDWERWYGDKVRKVKDVDGEIGWKTHKAWWTGLTILAFKIDSPLSCNSSSKRGTSA